MQAREIETSTEHKPSLAIDGTLSQGSSAKRLKRAAGGSSSIPSIESQWRHAERFYQSPRVSAVVSSYRVIGCGWFRRNAIAEGGSLTREPLAVVFRPFAGRVYVVLRKVAIVPIWQSIGFRFSAANRWWGLGKLRWFWR